MYVVGVCKKTTGGRVRIRVGRCGRWVPPAMPVAAPAKGLNPPKYGRRPPCPTNLTEHSQVCQRASHHRHYNVFANPNETVPAWFTFYFVKRINSFIQTSVDKTLDYHYSEKALKSFLAGLRPVPHWGSLRFSPTLLPLNAFGVSVSAPRSSHLWRSGLAPQNVNPGAATRPCPGRRWGRWSFCTHRISRIIVYTTRTTHVRFDSLLLSVKLCFVTLHIIFSCKLRRTDIACEVFLVIYCHYYTYSMYTQPKPSIWRLWTKKCYFGVLVLPQQEILLVLFFTASPCSVWSVTSQSHPVFGDFYPIPTSEKERAKWKVFPRAGFSHLEVNKRRLITTIYLRKYLWCLTFISVGGSNTVIDFYLGLCWILYEGLFVPSSCT